jgi:hypothetical protein
LQLLAVREITLPAIGRIVGKHVALRSLRPSPTHQLAELILRIGESFIPAALGLDLIENEAGKGFLLGFRQLRRGGNCLLK